MKIIIVDRLNYPFGGTQKYVFSLFHLLKQNQHQVYLYNGKKIINDTDLNTLNFNSPKTNIFQKIESIYSVTGLIKSYFIFKKIKPDVIHLNNINYLITPSIIHAAKLLKIPVIAHLHDYKIVCAKSKLLNNKNKNCQQCQNQNYFSILKNNCTKSGKKNIFESLYYLMENTIHNKIFHFYKNINRFVAPSNFIKKTFVDMGFSYPISVINNFTSVTPNKNSQPSKHKNKIIYFGRLSSEKGLIELCKVIKGLPIHLTIVGTGPLYQKLNSISRKIKNIKMLPFQSEENLIKIISQNDYTIVPSVWPENASISIIESFTLAKPVIGNDIGGITEMVQDQNNGWLFSFDNPASLAEIFKKLLTLDTKTYLEMSANCYQTYKTKYSPNIHYQSLIKLYKNVINNN